MQPQCRISAFIGTLPLLLALTLVLQTTVRSQTSPAGNRSRLYSVRKIGKDIAATSINSRGQVVGCTLVGASQAYRTAPNSSLDTSTDMLGTLGGGSSVAYAINDSGQVVGGSPSGVGAGQEHAFRTAADGLVTPGVSDLGTLGGLYSEARGINASGRTVGWSYATGDSLRHAFSVNPSTALQPTADDLGGLGGTEATATATNDAGQVVGWARLPSGEGRAFRTAPNSKVNPETDDLGALVRESRAAAINAVGQVVGSSVGMIGSWRAFRTAPNSRINPATDDLGALQGCDSAEAYAINRSGDVVGRSYTASASNYTAFVYSNAHMDDLNSLIDGPAPLGLHLAEAVGINDSGQIVANGTDTATGNSSCAYVLTPVEVLPADAVSLFGSDGSGSKYTVVGIVCDNLRNMPSAMRDTLQFQLPDYPGAIVMSADIANSSASTGCIEPTPSSASPVAITDLRFVPPLEFNENQSPQTLGDITPSSTRTVSVTIHFQQGGKTYVVTKPVVLARPPVVLVHGINTGPDGWWPLITGMDGLAPGDLLTRKGNPVGFAVANYHDGFVNSLDGNCAVERAAIEVQRRVLDTLRNVRTAHVLPGGGVAWSLDLDVGYIPTQTDFVDFATAGALAIRRVDVVAWSYGGMAARWYIASRGDATSYGWYFWTNMLPPQSERGTTNFAQDGSPIRKLITLGSMWRGVPLANYANEVNLGTYWPPANKVKLAEAPLLGFGALNLAGFMEYSLNQRFNVPTRVPSMEVMAIESPWMRRLVYPDPGQPAVPKPFDDCVAYGSVAGDDNNYIVGIGDPYKLINESQSPSWFPGLGLEVRNGSSIGFSDGVVPVWSTAIPGTWGLDYITVPSNHSNYPSNQQTLEYVLTKLNDPGLRRGSDLNAVWQQTQTFSTTADRSWTFSPELMAPDPEKNYYYRDPLGIGRINPAWLATDRAPNISVRSIRRVHDQAGEAILLLLAVKNDDPNPSRIYDATVVYGVVYDASVVYGVLVPQRSLSVSDGGPADLPSGSEMVAELRFPVPAGLGVLKPGSAAVFTIRVTSGRTGAFVRCYRGMRLP